MPTSASEEEEDVDEMYEVIKDKMNNAKGRDYTVVMGDWNASVGEGREGQGNMAWGKGKIEDKKLVDF